MEHVFERREQLQDQPELLAQMFDRMALTCARMSHLRAHDVALPYTLAKLQVLDGNYPPTRKMYDDLAELKDDVEHAEEACRVAYSTLVRTPHANRCLLPLARLRSFTEDRLYHISKATMLSKTVAGGMGPRLYKKATKLAEKWLLELDAALCALNGESEPLLGERKKAFDVHVLAAAETVARKSVCVYEHVSIEEAFPHPAQDEWPTGDYTRDLEIELFTVRVFAMHGAETKEQRKLLEESLDILLAVGEDPPLDEMEGCEALPYAGFQRLLLLGGGKTFAAKCKVLQTWFKIHGQAALSCCNFAIHSMIGLDQESAAQPAKACARKNLVPRPGFCNLHRKWVLSPSSEDGDAATRRVRRLSDVVFQMQRGGELQRGCLDARFVEDEGIPSFCRAETALTHLQMARTRLARGANHHMLQRQIIDRSSMIAPAVSEATAEVSMVSALDILAVFGQEGLVFQQRSLHQFYVRVRLHAGNSVSSFLQLRFPRFAKDLLEMAVPAVMHRREAAQMTLFEVEHPIGVLLRSTRAGLAWRPQFGDLWITESDLVRAPKLREVLEQAAKQGAARFVRRSAGRRGVKEARKSFRLPVAVAATFLCPRPG